MDIDLKAVLNTAGPTTTLVFASWIFLQLLNQRYLEAYERYRSLLSELRQHGNHDQRHGSIQCLILLYKRRCQQMRLSMNLGVCAAMLLLTTLLTAILHMSLLPVMAVAWISLGACVVAILLLIGAAFLVLIENVLFQGAIDSEIEDIPELAQHSRHRSIGQRFPEAISVRSERS